MKRALVAICTTLLTACDAGPTALPAHDTSGSFAATSGPNSAERLPDLRTVVPQQVQLVRSGQRDLLRFSNGVANTGSGPLHIVPRFPLGDASQTQEAIQQVFDAAGNVVRESVVSVFEYHPDHNHWHIAGVAQYEVRAGRLNGPVVGSNSIKTTFCLIDWVRLEGNSSTTERTYWDCNRTAPYQGISAGWVDQYHQSLEGQSMDLTGVAPGRYYLVSTANPDRLFRELDVRNNTAWVAFDLDRDKNGNPRIAIIETSPCSGTLCGQSPNR